MIHKVLRLIGLSLGLLVVVFASFANAQDRPLRWPGVYATETDPFPSGVVDRPSAVPVFIGYTERAGTEDLPVKGPVLISSLLEYEKFFGGAPTYQYSIFSTDRPTEVDFEIDGQGYRLQPSAKGRVSYLYNSIRHFYANGGDFAYIISVGNYEDSPDIEDFTSGLALAATPQYLSPTLLLAPDALLLNIDDYYEFANQMLAQAGELADRFVIIDVYHGDQPLSADPITPHRAGLGTSDLRYGATYYPFLATSIVPPFDISRANIDETGEGLHLSDILGADVDGEMAELILASPDFDRIRAAIARHAGVLPPGPAMAGLFTQTDQAFGTWKSPANVSIQYVTALMASITDQDQGFLTLDAVAGKSINAIRSFPGAGVARVWGARTLDGNSQDWRYISVQRTVMELDLKIATLVESFVSLPNDASTWQSIKAAVSNHLSDLWSSGALPGAGPAEAYQVDIGLGSTMTPQDIQDNILRMEIKIAPARAYEYIILKYEQEMAVK